jgi:hypothetical protein
MTERFARAIMKAEHSDYDCAEPEAEENNAEASKSHR